MSAAVTPSLYGSGNTGGSSDASKRMVSLRLTSEGRAILKRLARNWGISQSAVLEVLLREAVAPTNRR